MTLAELADALGLPPRQIRYLIAEQVIPPAKTLGRGGNAFDDRHVAAGLAFKDLAARGYGVRKAKAELEARAALAAMIVEGGDDADRRRLDVGPIGVTVDVEALGAMPDGQVGALLDALRTRLLALRAEASSADTIARKDLAQ